jgi:KaiC/GvpD/RAD55 family RecA-like ATPase
VSYEHKVLASAIKSREAFETIEPHVKKADFTEQANVVWRAVGTYYERDPSATSCDAELLANEIGRNLTSDKHKEQFGQIVQDLYGSDVSPANVVHDFIAVKREAAGAKLASALLSGKHNSSTVDLVAEYELWATADKLDAGEEQQVFEAMSLEHIINVYNPDDLIKVWPTPLNNRLDGGLLPGHHLVVFARPEMGKTMFTVNATAGFLRQGKKVLYVGNEEPLEDIAVRIICRLTNKTKMEVMDDPTSAYKQALEVGYRNAILARLWPGTVREIEKLLVDHEPDVLVLDQLRNLSMKEDSLTRQLEKAAMAARNLGKKHGAMVMSVTQAGDSASGKAILEMGDVDSSNTGIPAQADVMVGIGASMEDIEMGRRVISLPKNKRSGQHGYFPVRVDPTRSRILGMEE